MTDLPHVIAGQPVPLAEEYIRVLEAFVREFDLPPDRRVLTAGNVNAAVDWWNGLQAEGREGAARKPVSFAPGKYVRLKSDTAGLPAGTRGMISGLVLTRPEDDGKLDVVFRSYIPGTPEYGDLKLLPEALEWDDDDD